MKNCQDSLEEFQTRSTEPATFRLRFEDVHGEAGGGVQRTSIDAADEAALVSDERLELPTRQCRKHEPYDSVGAAAAVRGIANTSQISSTNDAMIAMAMAIRTGVAQPECLRRHCSTESLQVERIHARMQPVTSRTSSTTWPKKNSAGCPLSENCQRQTTGRTGISVETVIITT